MVHQPATTRQCPKPAYKPYDVVISRRTVRQEPYGTDGRLIACCGDHKDTVHVLGTTVSALFSPNVPTYPIALT